MKNWHFIGVSILIRTPPQLGGAALQPFNGGWRVGLHFMSLFNGSKTVHDRSWDLFDHYMQTLRGGRPQIVEQKCARMDCNCGLSPMPMQQHEHPFTLRPNACARARARTPSPAAWTARCCTVV